MVLEGFSKFCVFENDFPNGPILTPKWVQKSPNILKNVFLKANRFSMSIFIDFWWIREPKTIPKWSPGHHQIPPRHSQSASWAYPDPKKQHKLDFYRFGVHLGSILKGFGSPTDSKTYKICFLAFHNSSSSSQTSASQPPASNLRACCLQSASAGFAKRKQCAGVLPPLRVRFRTT